MTGTSNVWASMSIDQEHGILYLPVSSRSQNFFGGNRTEELPLATSTTAFDAEAGKLLWSRQIVHHDVGFGIHLCARRVFGGNRS